MNLHERRYRELRKLVDRRLKQVVRAKKPQELTEACRYVLSAGGKRVRSTLVLLSCETVGGRTADAVDASAAIELMHNFTLVHDDIMDHAASRRGRPTVHTKWNVNNALLVGDVLLGLAYKRVLRTSSDRLQRILGLFTDAFVEVCEGQAFDLEFEMRDDVTVRDYFQMIGKKTGKLISSSTGLGALIGGGTEEQVSALRRFGHYIGLAFQLQDDLLDVVAEEKEFGKTIGGDIIEGKRTFLLLRSLEKARGKDRSALLRVMNRKSAPPLKSKQAQQREVGAVTAIFESTGAIAEARKRIRQYTREAENVLLTLPQSEARGHLLWFSHMLVKRNS